MDGEWTLNKEPLAYKTPLPAEPVACKHEFPSFSNLAFRVLCWDNFDIACGAAHACLHTFMNVLHHQLCGVTFMKSDVDLCMHVYIII